MKKTTFVALLLLSSQGFAENLNDSLQKIESEWVSIYYDTPKQQQLAAYGRLLDKTINLARQFPGNAEPFIWEAIVKATNADHQNPVSALEAVHEARDLLLKAIAINPQAMDGSAYVTLGTLYYLTPKWPIAFGDDAATKRMLIIGLKKKPNLPSNKPEIERLTAQKACLHLYLIQKTLNKVLIAYSNVH